MSARTLIELAALLSKMRREPVEQALAVQYPLLVAEFEQRMAACDDLDTLEQIVREDTGFFLPTMPRQEAFEKLLAGGRRSPFILKQYLLHLAVFGYINEQGEVDAQTDAKMDALEAELAEKS